MARMLHRSVQDKTPGQTKVFLATPVYQDLSPGYGYALLHTGAALRQTGIAYELAIFAGGCHVDDARNRLVAQFLAGDCTDLVFLDADLRWEPEDLVKLCQYDRDVVAGIYPLKQDDEQFPLQYLGIAGSTEIHADNDGLIEVKGVPTGFLRIRRAVLEQLAEQAVKHRSRDRAMPHLIPIIFERICDDGIRYSGDYVFCRKWRARGGRVHVAPEMRFEHAGDKTWAGSLGAWLRRTNGLTLKIGLQAIRERRETPGHLAEMFEAWGNPWAASPAFLAAAITLAREADGPILECGSGLTTLAMAAANPDQAIWSLEDDADWHRRVHAALDEHGLLNGNTVHCTVPLKDGWYVPASSAIPEHFALAVVDGPARQKGDRSGILTMSADRYLFDDTNSPPVAAAIGALCRRDGLVPLQVNGERPFAVIHKPVTQREAA